MCKTCIIPLIVCLAIPILACGPLNPLGGFGRVTGSGRMQTKEYDVAGFSAVEAGASFQVEISQGDSFRVVVTADDNLLRSLRVERHGDTLSLGLQSMRSYNWSQPPRAQIVMPALARLELSGAAAAILSGFRSDADLRLDLSGAARVKGDITAGDVKADLSGASEASLEGEALTLRADLSGGSTLALGSFPVQQATLEMSGGAQARVNVIEQLDYDLSGGSVLRYRGGPQIGRADTSGGSRAIAE